MNAATNNRLLRLVEASRELNVSYWALRDWCRAGKVRHHRIGKFLMIEQSELTRIREESLVRS